MRLRDVDGGAKFEAGPVSFKISEDEGNLIFKVSKWDLIHGDDLRFELRILGDDDAG
ncbi:MAG: hypothetical protein WC343_14625 [Bacilli bacterium]